MSDYGTELLKRQLNGEGRFSRLSEGASGGQQSFFVGFRKTATKTDFWCKVTMD